MNLVQTRGRQCRKLSRWPGRIAGALAIVWATLSGAAIAQQPSLHRTINLLEISTAPPGGGVSTFYASNNLGWGASNCPAATWAYFYSDRVNAKEMFALLMLAKQMGKQVELYGTCTSAAYFSVIQVVLID